MTPTQAHTVTSGRVPKRDYKAQVNVRLTHAARNLLVLLSRQRGISQADILEIVIREEAIRMGLKSGTLQVGKPTR